MDVTIVTIQGVWCDSSHDFVGFWIRIGPQQHILVARGNQIHLDYVCLCVFVVVVVT